MIENCKIKNKEELILTNRKCMATKYEEQSPRQWRQKLVNGLASAPNVQVVKLENSSIKFHRNFALYFYCILFNL